MPEAGSGAVFNFSTTPTPFVADELDLVVAGRVSPGILVSRLSGPGTGVDAFLAQHLHGALEKTQARELEACIQHVLTRQFQLQTTGPQTLVDRPDVNDDNVAFVRGGKLCCYPRGQELVLFILDTRQHPEASTPLRPDLVD